MGVRWVNGGGPSALCGGGPKKRGPFLVVGNMLISRGSNLKNEVNYQTIFITEHKNIGLSPHFFKYHSIKTGIIKL